MPSDQPRAVIGLEVHVQLTSLKTKLFCNCSADYRGAPPNTHVCPVCLGLPGALPVVNEEAVRKAIQVCLAVNGRVAKLLRFDRKHYFYPDLPKNYQITQYLEPICTGGYIEIESPSGTKRIRLRRINIEEDPGRIVYPGGGPLTSPYVLVDYNRSGVALLEIVTEPDMESPEEAVAFLEKLRSILEHLGVCDCGLEGAMRVDANISIEGGERVEVKNIGSFHEVKRALAYEITRQHDLLLKGKPVRRETRHWDPVRKVTLPARVKETEEDYRYMPDPNLPPVPIPSSLVEELRETLPELPDARAKRLVKEYGLRSQVAKVLVTRKVLADFFEDAARLYQGNYERMANYLVNDLLNWLKDDDLAGLYKRVKPEHLAKLMKLLDSGVISIRQAKEMAEHIAKRGADPEKLVDELGFRRIADPEKLRPVVEEVFRENPKAVEDALRNPKAVNFLVGMVMRKTRGRADPAVARRLVVEKLDEIRRSGA
ncbi:Aspartyl-tRNA(Asn) amidotransferase subunit B [Pyrodictium delaneyi]|uniref:Aspartyl/glutamyl-tRNA(Asn/Gln) amidotransferase subunit B n=1 Tax=Pyrodictium delaneyi TaxID=1273541 RepID=A0A0P0N573_9CREN|nr:Asp-tRNA(Asn)/Glu-tRNA(Gln) amidotransferase subunit GatB [Pyrodictium delaneyi]ALL01602.1 Aspartyl-tRNA(Asn) amidotransferase subunit B [Pyrodictium delaneyi]OWJ55157.1 aspartyl/glutamyl-tRNA amidotransferase subunit B [Pyrodictium delaneyi]